MSLPSKSVIEYSLPAARETHEIIAVNNNLLLISQQSDSSLVKVILDNNGVPTGSSKWQLTTPFSGLHGLVLGDSNTPVWATAQFDNVVLRINPGENNINSAPTVLSTLRIPSPASGPHGILFYRENLWIACKDSSHVVRISIPNTNSTSVYTVSRRPIFVAVHPSSDDVFASLDMSSKIWHLKNGVATEIDIPPSVGNTPVGLLAGPDRNLWVVLLGNSTTGTGTFGRINFDSSINWFSLTSDIGKDAGLIHIAFDTNPSRFWLLGSSTANASAPNAVFTVTIDNTNPPRIDVQNTIMLPTQWSWTHRVIFHRGSLYVTELTTSTLAHIRGAVMNGWPISETWDQYADFGLGLKANVITYSGTS